MKKTRYVILAAILAAGVWFLYEKYTTEGYFSFSSDRVQKAVIYEGHRTLSEGYEIPQEDIDKISAELLSSNKRKINEENLSYPNDAAVLDMLIGEHEEDKVEKELLLVRNNTNSVFAMVTLYDAEGKSKEQGYVVTSSWLAQYLDNLKVATK